ncbi:MAG: prepilin peptidase [Lachnospiraceae bacterium]|nr:prepilin peptidase [Lachnospiraceae bacterium]
MILLTLILLSAVYTDLKSFRIPNALILTGGGLGLILLLLEGLYQGQKIPSLLLFMTVRCALCLCMTALLIPLWKLKAIGGGDVKLLGICVIHIGFGRSLSGFIYALFISVLLSGIYLMPGFVLPGLRKPSDKQDRMHRIHFSIPLLLGMLWESKMGMLFDLPF